VGTVAPAYVPLVAKKVRLAPKQPATDAGMPYRYGVNVSDGTPNPATWPM